MKLKSNFQNQPFLHVSDCDCERFDEERAASNFQLVSCFPTLLIFACSGKNTRGPNFLDTQWSPGLLSVIHIVAK
jgi:hypothetical protein